MIIQHQQANGSIPHQLLHEGIGYLIVVKPHRNSQIEKEIPILQRSVLTVFLCLVGQDGSSPKQIQLLKVLIVSDPS